MFNSIRTAFWLIKYTRDNNKKFILSISLSLFISLADNFIFLFLVSLIANFSNGEASLITLLSVILTLGTIKILLSFINVNLIKESNNFIYKLEKKLLTKALTVDIETSESKDFYNLKQKAEFSLRNQYAVENMMEAFVKLITSFGSLFASFLVFSYMSFTLSMLVLCLIGLDFYMKINYASEDDNFYEKLAPVNNWIWYYAYLPFNNDKLLDIKANNMENIICRSYEEKIENTSELFKEYYGRNFKKHVSSKVIYTLIFCLVLLYLLFQIKSSGFLLASFSVIAIALLRLVDTLRNITDAVIDFYRYGIFSKSIVEFLSYNEKEKKEIRVDYNQKDLVLKADKLYFSYNQKKILEDINFLEKGNKLVIIVGENGSGKSTLIKLIAGIYEPSSGELSYANEPVSLLSYSHVSPVFQDFKFIKDFSSLENISTSIYNINLERIDTIEKYLDLDFNFDMNKRLGTELSDQYKDLSGGQENSLAILRSLYNDRKIFIMDEPTSAMDIKRERKIYQAVSKIKKDKLVFLVTHRLSAVHFADRIYFMDGGRLNIYESHKDAMLKSIKYKNLYTSYYDSYKGN
ncbi:ABC transporter ATP-binding protein [uncultured Anaerococcus sp.]|uniref:ATP-binding cassette domain-containing protein n=1 Tax=uncultured Anaerococcus sp. TaxID=293428 RepID=UPI0025DE1C58|nr:ABC transporter ATP-binding protein [uncultured Anaerococcus sp.]